MIYPVKSKHQWIIFNLSQQEVGGTLNQDFGYRAPIHLIKNSDSIIQFKETSSNYAVDKECHLADVGTSNLKLNLIF